MERDSGLNPIALPGQRIGLLGGSFDPAHAGHLHISEMALRRFRLDRVWWLVSPGNPLKPHGPAPLAERIAAARRIADDPRIVVTGIEARLGTRWTADTIAALKARFPGVRFVWLMGSDNLVQFSRWDRWRGIAAQVPIGVIARPASSSARAMRTVRPRATRRGSLNGASIVEKVSPGTPATANRPVTRSG